MRAIFFENDFRQLINHITFFVKDDINSRLIRYVPNSLSSVEEPVGNELTIFPESIITGEFTFRNPFMYVFTNETYIKLKKILDNKTVSTVEVTVNSKEMYINISYFHDHHDKNEIFILPELNNISV